MKGVNHMKKLLMMAGLLMVTFLPFQANAQDSQLYAVKLHADWCGGCKILEPELQAVREDLDSSDVLFVTLDLTNESSSHQAAQMANVLGLSDFYKSNEGKTGFVILVDANTGAEVARINSDMEAPEIKALIKDNLNS